MTMPSTRAWTAGLLRVLPLLLCLGLVAACGPSTTASPSEAATASAEPSSPGESTEPTTDGSIAPTTDASEEPSTGPGTSESPEASASPDGSEEPSASSSPPAASEEPSEDPSDDPDAEPATPAPIDVCAALPDADIAADAGVAVQSHIAGVSECSWLLAEGGRGINARVEQFAKTDLESLKGQFPDGQDVSDLGNGAWWLDDRSVLYALDGETLFAVQLSGYETADPRLDLARAITQRMIDRL